MEKDLKSIIDSVDENDKNQSLLERKIETFKEEVIRLKFTIREQKNLIQSLKTKGASKPTDDLDVDDDIQFLKDMIFTQRQEILKKDKEIDELFLQIGSQPERIDNNEDLASNEELQLGKEKINQLSSENEMYKNNDQNARNLITQLAATSDGYQAEIQDLKTQIEELKKNPVLTTDAEYEEIDSEEVEELKAEIEGYKEQINVLQQSLESAENASIQVKENIDNDKYQETIISLQQSLESAESASTKILEDAESQISMLTIQNDGYQAEIDLLLAQVQELGNQLGKEYDTRVKEESDELKSHIKVYQEEVNIEREKAEETLKLNESLKKQIEQLESKPAKRDKHKKKNKGRQPETIGEIGEIHRLKDEIEEYQREIVELKNRTINGIQIEEKEEGAPLKDMLDESLLEHLKEENVVLKAQIASLKQDLEEEKITSSEPVVEIETSDESKKFIVELEESNQRIERDLNNANGINDKLINEIDGYTKEISEQNEDIAKKNSKINALNTKTDSLKEVIQELENKLENPLERIEDNIINKSQLYDVESTEVILTLKNENKELKDSVTTLEEQSKDFNEKLMEYQSEITGYLEIISNLEKTNKVLSDELEQYKERESKQPLDVGLNQSFDIPYNDESTAIIKDLKEENQKLILDIKQIKTEMSVGLSDIEDYRQQIADLKKENYVLKAKLDLQNEIPQELQKTGDKSVVDMLIGNLKSNKPYAAKKYAILKLATINDDRIGKIFTELAHDHNWLLRFQLVKAIDKSANQEYKELLELLSIDVDIDVREAAREVISKF